MNEQKDLNQNYATAINGLSNNATNSHSNSYEYQSYVDSNTNRHSHYNNTYSNHSDSLSRDIYTNTSQFLFGSVPLAHPDIVPLKKVAFTHSYYEEDNNEDGSIDYGFDTLMVANTQAISEIINDVAQMSDDDNSKDSTHQSIHATELVKLLNSPMHESNNINNSDSNNITLNTSSCLDTTKANEGRIDKNSEDRDEGGNDDDMDLCVATTQDIEEENIEEVKESLNDSFTYNSDADDNNQQGWTQTSEETVIYAVPNTIATQLLPESNEIESNHVDNTISSHDYKDPYDSDVLLDEDTNYAPDTNTNDPEGNIKKSLEITSNKIILKETVPENGFNVTVNPKEIDKCGTMRDIDLKSSEPTSLTELKFNQDIAVNIQEDNNSNASMNNPAFQYQSSNSDNASATTLDVYQDIRAQPLTQNTSILVSALVKLSNSKETPSTELFKSDKPKSTSPIRSSSISSSPGNIWLKSPPKQPSLSQTKTSPVRKYITTIGLIPTSSTTPVDPLPERKLLKRKYASAERINSLSQDSNDIDFSSESNAISPSLIPNKHGEGVTVNPVASSSNGKSKTAIDSTKSTDVRNKILKSNDSEIEWSSQINLTDRTLKINSSIADNSALSQEDLDDNDIPKSWHKSYVNSSSFSVLWSVLKDCGWGWKKGKSIISYYYIRPGKTHTLPFIEGTDYFISEEEVFNYIKASIQSRKGKSSINQTLDSSAEKSKSTSRTRKSLDHQQYKVISNKSNMSVSKSNSKHDRTNVSSNQGSLRSKTKSIASDSSSSDEEGFEEIDDWRDLDINTVDWTVLWHLLKREGWSSTYGTGVVRFWYYRPGCVKKTAEPAIDKFGSEASVRQYLINTIDSDRNRKPIKPVIETQGYVWNPNIDAKVSLQDWSLVNKRKKRNIHARHFSESEDENDSENSVDESLNGQKKSSRDKISRSVSDTGNKKHHDHSSDSFYASEDEQEDIDVGISKSNDSRGRLVRPSHSKSINKRAITERQSHLNDYSDNENANDILDNRPPQSPDPQPKSAIRPPSPGRRSTCLPVHIRGEVVDNESGSKSTSSNRNGKNDKYSDKVNSTYESRIFEGLNVIVSGFTDKDKIERLIKQHKGTVCVEFPLPSYFTQKRNGSSEIQKYVVISHPTGFRRPKNLLALTYGITVVHELWLHRSIELRKRQPFTDYVMPSGTSSLYTCSAFPSGDRGYNMTLFQGVKFLNLADISWKIVIESAGGNIVEPSTTLYNDIRNSYRINDRVQYILVDSLSYREALIKESYQIGIQDKRASSSKQASNNNGSVLTPEAFQAVNSCIRRNSAMNFAVEGINIVSVEWLVNCIILSRIVSPDEKDVFQIDNLSIKQKPSVWKIGAANERYVLDDIVRYRSKPSKQIKSKSSENSEIEYGRIVSFYLSNPNDPNLQVRQAMQVRIKPLEVVCVDFTDMDISDISSTVIQKYNDIYGKKASSNSKKKPKQHDTSPTMVEIHQMKALTPSNVGTVGIDDLITIPADNIVSKIILLERKSYRALEYAWDDPNIFCVSAEWESQENDIDDCDYSPSARYQPLSHRLGSQDY